MFIPDYDKEEAARRQSEVSSIIEDSDKANIFYVPDEARQRYENIFNRETVDVYLEGAAARGIFIQSQLQSVIIILLSS